MTASRINIEQRPLTDQLTGDAAEDERKHDIFCATLSVALERGFGKVTLDAIAARAGLSKGGLLYHFATKAVLIREMLLYFKASEDHGQMRFSGGEQKTCSIDPLAVAALIAAAENPALLGSIAELLVSRTLQRKAAFTSRESEMLARCLANKIRFKPVR